MADPVIDVVGLTKSYSGRVVVADVSLRLEKGGIIGLVGANGGGKTTTLRMLAGLLRPDGGAGNVLGDDVLQPRPDRRRSIGYMGQRLGLYPDLTVAENLRFHADIHSLTQSKAVVSDNAERFGLSAVMTRRFGQLSGGWGRRVQFAATVLHKPDLLLLDEPTAGLDAVTRRDIWRWIADFAADGHGIVVSTHDLAEAEQCPAILHFHAGRAEGPTTPEALVLQTGTASLETAIVALTERAPA
jgi:ABC-2 type transport system ATP-binding protein